MKRSVCVGGGVLHAHVVFFKINTRKGDEKHINFVCYYLNFARGKPIYIRVHILVEACIYL